MHKTVGRENAPLTDVKSASKRTGLSTYYIYKGVQDGRIPHVKCGKTILINVPALLKQLGVPQD